MTANKRRRDASGPVVPTVTMSKQGRRHLSDAGPALWLRARLLHGRNRPIAKRRRIMAQSQPSSARDQVRDIVPGLIDLSERVLFGEVWERPGLSKRDRSLITCATLIALGRERQLVGHLQRALDNGLTKNELSEVITHLAFYAGWPAAMTAALVAKDVFDKK
jgi:4-carboxymuconolactone decarboxylase